MAEKSAAAAKMAQRVEASERYIRNGGAREGEPGEFDNLINDAVEKAKKSPKTEKAAAAVGSGAGNGAIDFVELPPPASPERPAAGARPKSAAAKSPGQQRKKKPTPAWALAPEQAKVREEEEEDDLLSFAEGLDFDRFEADMEEEDRGQAMERLELVEEAMRPKTSEQHYNGLVPKNPSEEESWFIGGGNDRPVGLYKLNPVAP
jgi:hypothetical protein